MARKPKGGDGQATADVATEPEQTAFELPDYHGRKPTAMRTSISGTGNRTTQSHGIGDRFVLVAEVKCAFAGHKEVDGKLVYVESYAVVDMFEVSDPKAGSRLVAAMRAAARRDADVGIRTALEGDGADMAGVGWTDASGVVLTEAEVAEIQGNPVAAFGLSGESVVAVYDGGQRVIWPDEFEQGAIRPTVGDLNWEGTRVAAILDGITGEVIEGEEPFATGGVVSAPDAVTLGEGGPEDVLPERHLPTTADFDFVKAHAIGALRDELEDITDADELHRLLNAEKQGRGDGSKPRDGAVKAIQARIDYVTTGVKLKLVKED